MALKIDAMTPTTAFHVTTGAQVFSYAIDARQAVSTHPLEWSLTPWSPSDASAARKTKHDQNVAAAKAAGQQPPDAPPEPAALAPDDQKALDEYNKSVAEAAKRLADHSKKTEEDRVIAEQIVTDEALVASAPPTPNPRPMTPAQIRRNASLTDEELATQKANATIVGGPRLGTLTPAEQKMVDDKAVADRQGASPNAPITGGPRINP
jgi:hypothetical protein